MKKHFKNYINLLLLALGLTTSAPSLRAVTFSAPNLTVAPGGIVAVPITASGFNLVASFQFTLQWDTSVMQLVSYSGMALPSFTFGDLSASQGKLRVLWDDQDGTAVFTVQFQAIGGLGSVSPISFSGKVGFRRTMRG